MSIVTSSELGGTEELLNYTIIKFNHYQNILLSNSTSTASKLVDEVNTPQFHILPKAHKPNIPGRPVVSPVECHTSKISKFVDHFLQPNAKSLPSYIKDTLDFINRINETKDTHKDTIPVILGVKSLYTNISNHEGIETSNSNKRIKFCISKAD